MAPRALGAGGADGEVRPSLTERPPRWLPTGWIGSRLLGSRSRLRFALPPPRIHLFPSLRGMTDIRTSTPAPFPWSARATDRLHSPLHLCFWPHHSPRLRSPPGPSRHPRVPLSTPRTTPDSSSSSCIGYNWLQESRYCPNHSGQHPLPKPFRSVSLVQAASEPSIPAHTCHGQLRLHGPPHHPPPAHRRFPRPCVSHFSAGRCGDRGGNRRTYHGKWHSRSCRTKYPQQLRLPARSLSTRNGKHAGNQLRPQQPLT